MFNLQKNLSATAEGILKKKFSDSTTVHFDVSFDESHGDLTSSVALQVAKKLQKSPRDIAEELAVGLRTCEGVRSVEVAGAGFVNVVLISSDLTNQLVVVEQSCLPAQKKKEQPVIIDFSAPNIAKPLGIHHILSTVIGQVLCNIYTHLGYETIAINHIGDWGTQFGKLAVAYQKWGKGKDLSESSVEDLLALYVKFHEEAERDPTLEEVGRKAFAALEKGDKELRAFWQSVVEITMKSLTQLYDRLHVRFDHTMGESFYEDRMAPIITEGKKKKIFTPGKEGALIVEFPEEQTLPPAIVVKADDSTIYLTRDLATARYRIDTWKPQSILYVVDVAQQLYFKQLFSTLELLGWDLPHMEHIIFGRMRFAEKAMSTRKGNILKLEDALDEAVARADAIIKERGEKIQTDNPSELAEMMGVGSLVYGILSQNRTMNMVFDWDKMLSFEGNSAPYLQYTHARAMSVLRKAGDEPRKHIPRIDTLTSHERTLLKLLLVFGDTLEEARRNHLPHTLTVYLYSLCQAYNAFYNSDEILSQTGDIRALRLLLTRLTALVLKTGAEILTIRVPDRM